MVLVHQVIINMETNVWEWHYEEEVHDDRVEITGDPRWNNPPDKATVILPSEEKPGSLCAYIGGFDTDRQAHGTFLIDSIEGAKQVVALLKHAIDIAENGCEILLDE